MKFSHKWIVIIFCVNYSAVNAVPTMNLLTLRQEAINNYERKIARELKVRKLQQIGTATIFLGLSSYGIYQYFFASDAKIITKNAQHSNPATSQDIDYLKKESQEIKNDVSWIKEVIANYLQSIKKPQDKSWLKWGTAKVSAAIRTIMDGAVVLIVANGITGSLGSLHKYVNKADQFLEKMVAKVFYSCSLPWFISTHTNLGLLFDECQKQSALLDGQTITMQQQKLLSEYRPSQETQKIDMPLIPSHDVEYTVNGFSKAWNMLIPQLESLIAFMKVKNAIRFKQNPIVAVRCKEIIRNIESIIVEKTQSLSILLEKVVQRSENSGSLYQEIRLLRSSLDQELNSYVNIESIKSYD